jgi:hypothetical protein
MELCHYNRRAEVGVYYFPVMIDPRQGSWEIVPFARHKAAGRYVQSLDRGEAEDFLRLRRSDFSFLFELRELLSRTDPVHRMTDDQVIETIACRLATRELLLRVTERRWEGDSGGNEKSEKQSVPEPDRAPSSAPPKIEEPEPNFFDSSHDGAAQAAALEAAAESGVPFCQECEKQKRAAA